MSCNLSRKGGKGILDFIEKERDKFVCGVPRGLVDLVVGGLCRQKSKKLKKLYASLGQSKC